MIETLQSHWYFFVIIAWYGFEKYRLIFNKKRNDRF